MKPAVDEMFPEGAGPYVDLDEILKISLMMMMSSEAIQSYMLHICDMSQFSQDRIDDCRDLAEVTRRQDLVTHRRGTV
ncbi:COP9 signalosome complex subunit 9 [Phodopus roborovskii]|uniref:COP9 signalosome complex subunit 9 n=1 Tax=Phodopus roborovskii TaxID=109678 RepID=UPI0021E3E401|nr:COP9 signalosome complex subunit 9 [Phodopus roborovskii]